MVGEPDIQNREPRLADYAERRGAAERDGVALHLHMGSLRAEHRQPFHNRLCHETLRPIVEQHKGALYQTISGDMGAALFVRDYLQSRGYRVALDGTNHLTLPLIGRERLGFDFIKLRWGPDYETAIVESPAHRVGGGYRADRPGADHSHRLSLRARGQCRTGVGDRHVPGRLHRDHAALRGDRAAQGKGRGLMDAARLAEILDAHEAWLGNRRGGERANLGKAALAGADLSGRDLRNIDLAGADLAKADFSDTDLSFATLTGAILTRANLRGAVRAKSDLRGVVAHPVPWTQVCLTRRA